MSLLHGMLFVEAKINDRWQEITPIFRGDFVEESKYDYAISKTSEIRKAIEDFNVPKGTPLRVIQMSEENGGVRKKYAEFSRWDILQNGELIFLDAKNTLKKYEEFNEAE